MTMKNHTNMRAPLNCCRWPSSVNHGDKAVELNYKADIKPDGDWIIQLDEHEIIVDALKVIEGY